MDTLLNVQFHQIASAGVFLSRPIEVVGQVSCVHTGVSYDSLGSELLSFPADPAIGCARLLGLRGDVIFDTLLRV